MLAREKVSPGGDMFSCRGGGVAFIKGKNGNNYKSHCFWAARGINYVIGLLAQTLKNLATNFNSLEIGLENFPYLLYSSFYKNS